MNDELARLDEELREAEAELALIEKKLEEKGDFGLGQGASTTYEWEINLALRESVQEKIKSIEEAIERLRQGAYGLCEDCGNPIAPERLEILPHTTLCIDCARQKH